MTGPSSRLTCRSCTKTSCRSFALPLFLPQWLGSRIGLQRSVGHCSGVPGPNIYRIPEPVPGNHTARTHPCAAVDHTSTPLLARVCITNLFSYFILLEPPSSLLQMNTQVIRYTRILPLALQKCLFHPSYTPIYPRRSFLLPPSFLSHSPNFRPAARLSSLCLSSLWGFYILHGAISAITAPSTRSGLWRMYASLYLAPQRRRVLDPTIASDIQASTKPHIHKFSHLSLLLRSEDRRCYASMASIPGITSVEYTIGVK